MDKKPVKIGRPKEFKTGSLIGDFRKKHNLSQVRLAKILKIPRSTLQGYEQKIRREPEYLEQYLKLVEKNKLIKNSA